MGTEKCESIIKETLKNLCCSNGWCYGIFWVFDQRNSLLLTLKDAHYEEQMGDLKPLIDNMLLQVHVLGGGVIGQSAFTKTQRWMFSDDHNERQNSLGSLENLEVPQDDSEFYCQFSMGIKTIALISVEPWGVVQFGSIQKIPERKDFIEQVKELFRGMDDDQKFKLAENEPSSSDSRFYDSSMLFTPLLPCSMSHSMNQNFQHDGFCEGFVDSNNSLVLPSQLDELFLESGNFFDCSATQALSGNSDCSVVTSSWPHLTSELNFNVNTVSTSLQDQQLISKDLLNTQDFNMLLDPSDFKVQRPSGLLTLEELFQENDFAEALSKSCQRDDISQWFSPMLGTNTNSSTTLISNGLSHNNGLIPVSDLKGRSSPINMSENLATNSVLSSVTDAFRTNHADKNLQGWSETLMPVVDCDDLNFSTDDSECISGRFVGSKVMTSNSLFSKLGLDQLLDGIASTSCTFANSRFDDQSSSPAKRRKIENYSWSHNQVKIQDSPNFDGKMKSLDREASSRKEPSSCIGNRCSMDAGNSSSSKRQEPAKTGKKKAKMGTKPRPKDRQMIQDRLAELRGLIPNGEKMSIDRLLERTIRHLNFMHSLTKHAETLRQTDKPKSGAVPKDNFSSGGGSSGVTWACEVGDQSMVCPLKVEDLSTPGQMLIEILCEEQGFFLEIVDLIRGFGLIILKGVMEVREAKIWAHFIVEAEGNRLVTRHEIFSSLIQLLQMTGQNAANANDRVTNVMSSGLSLFNRHQPVISFPVNLIG